MKKSNLIFALAMLLTTAFYAQVTTIVNYNFNSVSAYPIQPTATASNVTCSGTSSEPFQTFTGVASGSGAFTPNTTSGNAIAMSNSSGTNTRYFLFQLGGADLSSYQSYKVYLQPQRSSTGATLITVAYSTDGSSYTNFSTSYPVSTTFSDVLIDLSSITVLNNVSAVYIKLMVSGTTAPAGTIRIDNFQIQANKNGSSGGSNPWQVNGNNVNFAGNVGIGTASPIAPLDVNGNANINGNITTTATKNITAGGNIIGNSNLTIAGTSAFNGDVTTAANKNITAGGNIIGNGNLSVSGNATFNNSVTIGSKLQFGNSISKASIGFTPSSSSGPGIFSFGFIDLGSPPLSNCVPFFEAPPVINQFGSLLEIYHTDASNNYVTGSAILDIGAYSNSAYLNSRYKPLSINAECASDVYLMGTKVGFGTSAPIEKFHFTNGNILIDGNNSTGNNYRVKIDGGVQPGLQITTTNVNAFDIVDPNTNISNFRVKLNGIAYAREVIVTLNPFPDYVFANNYKLPKLSEVKDFISKNHRLINMPSASEIKENGASLGEVQRVTVEKLEEAYLYILQLEEKLNVLSKKMEVLEAKK